MSVSSNLLLTGPSGIGKSTLLAMIPSRLPQGEGGVLAHLEIESDYRLGRYGVDMQLFHRIMMPQLQVDAAVDLYLIDEVAAIASWSAQFMEALDAFSTPIDSSLRSSGSIHVIRIRASSRSETMWTCGRSMKTTETSF